MSSVPPTSYPGSPRRAVAAMALTFAIAAVSAACSSDAGGPVSDPPTTASHDATETPTQDATATGPEFDGQGADVDASMLGHDWPLTITSGRVNCVRTASGVQVVFTSDDNERYALNGTAKAAAADFGYLSLNKIWADDPSTGAKKDIGVLISICDPLM